MQQARFWVTSGIATAAIVLLFYKTAVSSHAHNISYDTYLSVTLTALGVILAALALFVGAAAIWGYQQISAQAERHAESAVEKRLATLLKESNVRQTILTHVRAEADEVYKDLQVTSLDTQLQEHKPVAAPYPGEQK